MNKLDFSDFSEELTDELIDIYMRAYEGMEEYGEPSRRRAKKYLRWLKNHSDFFKIAFVSGVTAGFVAGSSDWLWHGRVGEIHELCVAPEFQGEGIGKTMMSIIIDFFMKSGVKRAGLWVGEKNFRAIRFYESLGFRMTGERFPGWLRMEKEI